MTAAKVGPAGAVEARGGQGGSGSGADPGALAMTAVEPPKQARSRRTYHRLLEAASELLADRPFDEITVDEIAERAGYTKGAFYARFDSKAALLRHLVARLTEGALDAWDAFLDPDRWADASLEDVVEAFVHRMVAIYTRSGHLMGAIDREVQLGGDPAVRATMRDLNERVADGFVRLLETRRSELPPHVRADIRGACGYWLAALAGVLRSAYLRPPDGLAAGPPGALAERTLRLTVPYLTDRA